MKHQRNLQEPRQYFNNSLCLFCRGWSSFGEYFCHSAKQVYLDGVTYLLAYSRIVFHPSVSCLGLREGDECTGISLITIKAFKAQVLQGVLETRRHQTPQGMLVQHQLPQGPCVIVAALLAAPLARKLISTESTSQPTCGPAEQQTCL